MANVEKIPNDCTVHELKEILRDMDLSTANVKTKLIARILDKDPTNEWMLTRSSCDRLFFQGKRYEMQNVKKRALS